MAFAPTLHDYDKRLLRYKNLIIESKKITARSKELIFKFIEACIRDGLSKARQTKYFELLKGIAEKLGKDLDKVSKSDIEWLVSEIEQANYSAWTKQSYKTALKKFYRWLHGMPRGEYPDLVKWIKLGSKVNNDKLPEDLLTEEEVLKLIEATPHPRDKALIALLWDGGLRIGEVGTLRLKNVTFDNYGGVLIVRGKKGMRRVRTVWSVPYLANWLESHPDRDNPEAPLWVKLGIEGDNGAMNYDGIRKQIITAAKKAGIKKRIHPHLFRHSRATYMAKYLTEAQMKEYFGWVQSSDMAAMYVHLSGRDVDDAILRMHGLKKEEEEDKPKAVKCPRCRKVNGLQAKFCYNCGAPLDLKIMMELEESIAELGKGFGGLASTKPEMLKDMVEFLRVIEIFSKNPALLEEAKKFIVQMERKGQAVGSK
jgi:integrase